MRPGDRVVYVGPNSRARGNKAIVRSGREGDWVRVTWADGTDGAALLSSLVLDTETEKPNDEAQAWLDWIEAHPLRHYCRE